MTVWHPVRGGDRLGQSWSTHAPLPLTHLLTLLFPPTCARLHLIPYALSLSAAFDLCFSIKSF